MKPIGLVDKLYWRRHGRFWNCFHCFKKSGRVYISLCGDHQIARSGGQAINRPEAWARCARCDAAEMERRGADKSLPPRPRNMLRKG